MSKSFYNTIRSEGQQLLEAEKQAKTLERRIKKYYNLFPKGTGFTPLEMWDKIIGKHENIQVTSVRRAMTNLTGAEWNDFLVKGDKSEMKMERFGKPNHVWKSR